MFLYNLLTYNSNNFLHCFCCINPQFTVGNYEWFLLESSILILSVLIGHYLWRSGLPKLRLLADLFSSYLLFNFYFFKSWVQEKCNPLVREITFENAEELTEEGLPFLILFHHPDDTTSIKVGINSRLFSLINQSLI